MTRVSLPILAFAVVVASGGCQLLVPSEEELAGTASQTDAGSTNLPDAELDAAEAGPPSDADIDAGVDADIDAGGVSLVQQTTGTQANTTSLTLTLPAAPRDGSVLVVAIASLVAGGGPAPTFTVSGGGVAWSLRSASSARVVSAVLGGLAVSSGGTTVTVTASSTQTTLLAHLSEWTGLSAFGVSVKSNGTSSSVATAPLAVPGGTGLVFAAAATHLTALGPPANGFVALASATSADHQIVQAYRLSPPAGAYSTSWTEVTPSGSGWDTNAISLTR